MADVEKTEARAEASGQAIASLVCGILAITGVLPCIGSVLAIALGWNEESGVGRAGIILGFLSLLVPLAFLILVGCFGVPVAFGYGLFG